MPSLSWRSGWRPGVDTSDARAQASATVDALAGGVLGWRRTASGEAVPVGSEVPPPPPPRKQWRERNKLMEELGWPLRWPLRRPQAFHVEPGGSG